MAVLAPLHSARSLARPVSDRRRRMLADARSWLLVALPGLLVGVGLLTPLIWLAAQGISLVGLSEESTGYRYFYSLRTLYTPDERPRLPQGQLVTLVHFGLQLALTASGFPPGQLTPRIDLFAYAGAALPHLLTAAALVWAVRPLRSLIGRLAVAAAVVVVSTDRAYSGFHLAIPDYYSWIHTVAVVSLGCCLRLTDARWRPSRSWLLGLGLFCGACLAVKLTLVAFAIPPVLLLARRSGSGKRAVGAIVAIGGLGALTLGVTTFLAYGGSMAHVLLHLASLARFGATQSGALVQLPEQTPLAMLLAGGSLILPLSVALPFLLGVSAARGRCRTMSLALLAGSLVSLSVALARFLPTTLIEVGDFALVAAAAWCVRVGGPAVRMLSGWTAGASWKRAKLPRLATGLMLMMAILRAHASATTLAPGFVEADRVQLAIDRFAQETPGRTAIFTLGNDHRPLTRDGAIFKGGTNSGESSVWGVSPFVQALAPDRHYFFPSPDLPVPVDTSSFTRLLFVSLEGPERLDATAGRLAETFGVSLVGFECPLQEVRSLAGGVQYGCRRIPDAHIDGHRGEIAYTASATTLAPGAPVGRSVGPARALAPGEAVYSRATGEIWRLGEAGAFTRLVGNPGQLLEIDAAGEWSGRKHALSGLPARFDGIRWRLAPEVGRPINKNAALRLREDASLRGWDVLERDGVTVERSDETAPAAADRDTAEDGGWLELRSRREGARVGLRTSVDVTDLRGSPIVATVQVRGLGQGALVAHLGNVQDSRVAGIVGSAWPRAIDTVTSGEWQTVTLSLEPDQVIAERLELVVELENAAPGDGLDIQHAEILAGRFPEE